MKIIPRNRISKGHLYKRGSTWWVQWKYKKAPYALSLETGNKTKAESLLKTKMNEVKASIADGSFFQKFGKGHQKSQIVNDILLHDIWNQYVKSVNRPDTGKSTMEQYYYQTASFVKWIQKEYPHITKYSAINKTIARNFASHINETSSPNTFNKYINLLRMIFRTLNDTLDIAVNPWENIQRKKTETNGKRDFTKAEVELILSKAEGDIYTLCLLGSNTGFRLGDCSLLEWSEINLENRLIKRVASKTRSRTGKVVRMYIFDDLLNHLKELKKVATSKYVCPDMSETYLRDRGATVSRRVQRFFQSCGIELYREIDGKKVTEAGFHSFRHYLCTLAEEKGVPEAISKEIFGWGSSHMKKIYTHISDTYFTESVKKMEKTEPEPLRISNDINNMPANELLKMVQELQQELQRREVVNL